MYLSYYCHNSEAAHIVAANQGPSFGQQRTLTMLRRKEVVNEYRADVLAKVVLKAAPNAMQVAAKYDAVHHIALEKSFIAPRVLGISDSITLEKLNNIISLRDIYIDCHLSRDAAGNSRDLIRRAGEVLGHLHAFMPTTTNEWVASKQFCTALKRYGWENWDAQLDRATLHGDYSFANVFVEQTTGKIAVIDPCPNGSSSFLPWECGPIYVDIGKFLACLEGQVPLRNQVSLSRKRCNLLQKDFIDGYQCASGKLIDLPTAFAFAYGTAKAQFLNRHNNLGQVKAAFLYNRLRRNFPLTKKLEAFSS